MWRRVCVIGLFVQTFCYWAHICTLFPLFPNVLFPWVAWILPPDLLVSQWVRGQRGQPGAHGEAGDDPAVLQCLVWVFARKSALLQWGGDRLRCHQGAAASPWPQQGDRKDTEYTEKANFSCEFNLSSWRCNRGKWPIGVSGGLKAGEFCWHTIH